MSSRAEGIEKIITQNFDIPECWGQISWLKSNATRAGAFNSKTLQGGKAMEETRPGCRAVNEIPGISTSSVVTAPYRGNDDVKRLLPTQISLDISWKAAQSEEKKLLKGNGKAILLSPIWAPWFKWIECRYKYPKLATKLV